MTSLHRRLNERHDLLPIAAQDFAVVTIGESLQVKVGKNNPKAAEIEADNAARQDWNRTADMALVSGIAEAKIIEIRNEHVYDEATRSVQKHGWLPGLFRGIIQKAKEILMGLIRETEVPPKPTLSVDMAEYRKMQKLMVKVQDEARAVKHTARCRS